MTKLSILLAAFTTLPMTAPIALAAPPQDSKPQERKWTDELLYRAFYAEVAERDFAGAVAHYQQAIDEFEKKKQTDPLVKSLVGVARCLTALGRRDEAAVELKKALALKPDDADAKAELAKLAAPSATDERIVNRIIELVGQLGNEAASGGALVDLERMGTLAVPTLSQLLRDVDVTVAAHAARALAHVTIPASYDALAAALADPKILYPRVIVEALVNEQRDLNRATLPAFVAVFDRKEVDLRRWFAETLRNNSGFASDDAAVGAELFRKVSYDSEPAVRAIAFSTALAANDLVVIGPMLKEMLASPDSEERRLAANCIAVNAGNLPRGVLDDAIERVKQDPDPEIRASALGAEYCRVRQGEPALAAAVVLRMLADESAKVFALGASMLDDGDVRKQMTEAAHACLAKALARVLEDPALSRETRIKVVKRIEPDLLTDDELIDLLVRSGTSGRTSSDVWVADARASFARSLLKRRDVDNVDDLATAVLARIGDAAGRRLWFDRCVNQAGNHRMNVILAAANDDDPALRDLAYRRIQNLPAEATQHDLRHFAEDLLRFDDHLALSCLNAVPATSPAPELVAPLRVILARAKGVLRRVALRRFADAAGPEALAVLRAEMNATPKDVGFACLDKVEKLAGPGLVQELIELAKKHGDATTVVRWMFWEGSNDASVSPAMIERFVRMVPRELVTSEVIDKAANVIPVGMLGQLIIDALRTGDHATKLVVIQIAGDHGVEAAWDELTRLLDSGDGEVCSYALRSLKQLREYRELRRSIAANDDDQRRAALEKAKALVTSKDLNQRVGAALALGALGDVATVPLLLDLCADPEAEVQHAAKKALEKLNAAPSAPAATPKENH